MAFLYSTYIVIYAIANPLIGKYIDRISNENDGDIHSAVRNFAGVQFTIIGVVIMAATFIPKGSLSLNPHMLFNENLDGPIESTETLVQGDAVYKTMEKNSQQASEDGLEPPHKI